MAAAPAPRTTTMSERRRLAVRGNRILDALMTALRMPPPPDGTVLVCSATEAEWNAFIDRNDLPIKANWLQWFAETNAIHIVEFGPGRPHEAFVGALTELFRSGPGVRQWLASGGTAENSHGPANLPDLSYGPRASVPGVQLPADTLWENFLTIKVEIGVSQQWGNAAGQLDHKAETVWAPMAGVQYVLCIKTDDRLAEAHYKLYDVTLNDPVAFTVDANPVAIVQGTRVHFDARRVLGIPAAGQVPAGFPDPFVVDLFAALEEARLDLPPAQPPA